MRKIWIGALGLALAGCGGGDLGKAASELPAAWEAYKAAGLPTVAADLDFPPVPGPKNAAIQMRKVGLYETADREARLWHREISDLGYKREYAVLGRKLEGNRYMLAAEQVARLEWAPVRDYDLGSWVSFPELAEVKGAAKLLGYRALARAYRGDVSGAIDDLKLQGRYSGFMIKEPSLIGGLVAIALEAIRMRNVETAAEFWKDKPAALKRLLAETAPVQSPDYLTMMKGEAYMGLSNLRNIPSGMSPEAFMKQFQVFDEEEPVKPPKNPIREGLPTDRNSRAFLARHLQHYTALWPKLEAAKGNPIGQAKAMSGFGEPLGKGPSYTFQDILLPPVLDQVGNAVIRGRAVGSMTRAKVAALEFRSRAGRFPKNLAEAGFKQADPFSGKSYGYRVEGRGFRIWSVGQDRIDQGGTSRIEAQKKTPPGGPSATDYDEVVIYPLPPPGSP